MGCANFLSHHKSDVKAMFCGLETVVRKVYSVAEAKNKQTLHTGDSYHGHAGSYV